MLTFRLVSLEECSSSGHFEITGLGDLFRSVGCTPFLLPQYWPEHREEALAMAAGVHLRQLCLRTRHPLLARRAGRRGDVRARRLSAARGRSLGEEPLPRRFPVREHHRHCPERVGAGGAALGT